MAAEPDRPALTTTAEVVDGLERERARLLDAVDALGPRADTEWVTKAGGWTAHDVLAHLIHYAGLIAFALGAPEQPPAYVVAVRERLSPQEWNERAVDYWRPSSLADVRAEFARISAVIIERARTKSDDEMNATGAMPWAADVPLWQFVGGDTYLHEWPAHATQIEARA